MNQVAAPDIPADLRWLDPPPNGTGSLLDWRGTTVLLHFWTRSCVNCRQVGAELERVIGPFRSQVQVIGVHAPKFEAERDDEVVRRGMEHFGIDHPVINDPDHRLCRLYGLQGWPTIVVIDANGRLVCEAVGEAAAAKLDQLLRSIVSPDGPDRTDPATHPRGTDRDGPDRTDPDADPRGTDRDGPDRTDPATHPRGTDRDVGVSRDGGRGGADHRGSRTDRRGSGRGTGQRGGSGNGGGGIVVRHPNRLLVIDGGWLVSEQRGGVVQLDRRWRPLKRFGEFGDPAGMCLLPDGRVAVADAANHRVVALALDSSHREVLVGNGHRGDRRVRLGTRAAEAELASPQGVAWWRDQLVVAVTGLHQLIGVPEADPGAGVLVIAGSSAEGLKDGTARRARLAMPTSVAADGDRLWFADADTSALRWVEDGLVGTAVGRSLDVSGHHDGPADEALLQHPAGICLDHERRVLVADVFNGAVRRFDPAGNTVETVAEGLREPTDIAVSDGGIVVVERSGHHIGSAPLRPRRATGRRHTFSVAPTPVAPRLSLRFAGDGEFDLDIAAEPPELLETVTRQGAETEVVFSSTMRAGHLTVDVNRRDCGDWCSVERLTWSLPITVTAHGMTSLPLLPR